MIITHQLFKCTTCNQDKSIEQFYNWKKEHKCKVCKAKADRDRKARNKELNLAGTPKIVRLEKKCHKCKETKPISEFYKLLSSEDGYGPRCNKCNYKVSRQWQIDNPEKRNEQNRKRWPKYYQNGGREKKKKYRQENPEIQAKVNHNRRARLKAATIEPVDFKKIDERDKGLCYLCDKLCSKEVDKFHPDKWTYDHRVPLSKGGAHSERNIRVCCWQCNNSKNTREEIDFRNNLSI